MFNLNYISIAIGITVMSFLRRSPDDTAKKGWLLMRNRNVASKGPLSLFLSFSLFLSPSLPFLFFFLIVYFIFLSFCIFVSFLSQLLFFKCLIYQTCKIYLYKNYFFIITKSKFIKKLHYCQIITFLQRTNDET